MKKSISRIVHAILYTAVGVIVVMAMLTSVARVATPYLNTHKDTLATWISQLLGPDVTLDSVEVTWHGVTPSLQIHNVALHRHNHPEKLLVHVDTINIDAHIFQSLWQWEFQPGTVILSGMQLTLWQQTNGAITLQQTPNTSITSSSQLDSQHVIGWLANQHRIELHHLQLTLHLANDRIITLTNLYGRLNNTNNQHQLRGGFILQQPNKQPARIRFNTRISTDLSADNIKKTDSISSLLAHITSKTYMTVSQLQLPIWLAKYTVRNWHVTSGIGNLQLWLDWQGPTQTLQANAKVKLAKLGIRDHTQRDYYQNDYLSGALSLTVDPAHWQFSAHQIQFNQQPDATSHDVSFVGNMQNGQPGTIQAIWLSDLQLDWLTQLNQLHLFTHPDVIALFDHSHLAGQLHNVYFHLNPQTQGPKWVVLAEFSHLHTQTWQSFPGVRGLSGQIQITPYHGLVIFNSHNAQFDYPAWFAKPLDITQLQGELYLAHTQQGWLIDLEHFHMTNPNLNLYGNSHLVVPLNHDPTSLDLALGFDITQLDQLANVYPSQITPTGLKDWLNHNIIDGDHLIGNMLMRGPINAFPFHKQQGVFYVEAAAKNLTFVPATGWPVIPNVDATFAIKQGHFQFHVPKTMLYGNTLSTINAEIVAIDQPTPLIINGQVQGDLQDVQHYLLDTPLVKILPLLTSINGSGDVAGEVTLQIPLDDDTPSQTRASVSFNDAKLTLPYTLPALTHIQGDITIENEAISALGIKATWFNQPSSIDISTQRLSNNSVITINLDGLLDSKVLLKHIGDTWKPYFTGKTPFTLTFDYSTDPNQPTYTIVKSNLVGMQINAPMPFAKTTSQIRQSQLKLALSHDVLQTLSFYYGNELAGAFRLKSPDNTIEAGQIVFGSQQATAPTGNGIFINGHLPHLSTTDLTSLLAKQKTQSTHKPSWLANIRDQLSRVNIDFDRVDFLTQTLSPANIVATFKNQATQVKLQSPQLRGHVRIPTDLSKQPISGAIDYWQLHLDKKNRDLSFKLAEVPALDLTINRLTIDDDVIGKVGLRTQPIKDGIRIQQVKLSNRYFNLDAAGNWRQTAKSDHSELHGNINTQHLDRLLKYWNKIKDIEGTSGDIAFDLQWPDKLFNYQLNNLTGKAAITLGKGRIINIGKDAESKNMNIGRLLNVFSVSALSRRLKLDFSDLTKKGYSFDSVKGGFVLNHGVATTSDTLVKGSIADLHLAGDINTRKKSYDLLLTVIPHLTSSLPVIATVAGTAALGPLGAAIGAATWLVDKAVLSPSVGKLTSYVYKITGPWDNPNMVEVKTKK